MKEMLSGFICCDLKTTEQTVITDGKKEVTQVDQFVFNPGRLAASVLLLAAGAAVGTFII